MVPDLARIFWDQSSRSRDDIGILAAVQCKLVSDLISAFLVSSFHSIHSSLAVSFDSPVGVGSEPEWQWWIIIVMKSSGRRVTSPDPMSEQNAVTPVKHVNLGRHNEKVM